MMGMRTRVERLGSRMSSRTHLVQLFTILAWVAADLDTARAGDNPEHQQIRRQLDAAIPSVLAPNKLAALVQDLASPSFTRRAEATRQLRQAGPQILEQLGAITQRSQNLEQIRRAKSIAREISTRWNPTRISTLNQLVQRSEALGSAECCKFLLELLPNAHRDGALSASDFKWI